MVRFTKKLFVFIFILATLGYLLDFVFQIIFTKNLHNKVYWAWNKRGETWDFLILGSSRPLGALDMNLLNSVAGQSGVNFAGEGSGFIDNYLLFNKFIDDNRCKSLIFQCDSFSLDADSSISNNFHDYYFVPFFSHNKEVNEAIRQYGPHRDTAWLWSIFPFTKYLQFNSYFNVQSLCNIFRPSHLDESFGGDESKYYSIISANNEIPIKKKRYQLAQKDLIYFTKIIAKAKEKNLKIVIFTTPIHKSFLNSRDLSIGMDYISKFSERNKIKYLDYSFDVRFQKVEYFKDATHLNYYGKVYFSEIFGKDLRNFFNEESYCCPR